MTDLPAPRDMMLSGLMARGISLSQAQAELREIEIELAYRAHPKTARMYDAFYRTSWRSTPQRRRRLPASVVEEVRLRSGGICAYCAAPFVGGGRNPREFTIDHVVPLATGGADDPDNLTAACRGCNTRKGVAPASIFRAMGVPSDR